MPTDGYALAIPVSRLQSTALEVAPECGCHSDASEFCTWIRDQGAAQPASAHGAAKSRLVAEREPV